MVAVDGITSHDVSRILICKQVYSHANCVMYPVRELLTVAAARDEFAWKLRHAGVQSVPTCAQLENF